MLPPRKVKYAAKQKENENIRFRTFLKSRADEDELDQQFYDLHVKLFSNYDCSRCRNCCKECHGTFSHDELDKCAAALDVTKDDFIKKYLNKSMEWGEYQTKNMPCDFLLANGECKLGESKPKGCKEFPHTNKPERLQSLYSVLNVASVCPVAFEIVEQLKKIYGFKYRY